MMALDKLHFAGSLEPPEHPAKVMRQRLEPAREEAPEEVLPPYDTAIYMAARPDIEPRVAMARADRRNGEAIWRFDVSGGVALDGVHVESMVRRRAEEICGEISLPIDVEDFRPPWADVAYAPPAAPEGDRLLRRMRRGFV